MLAERQTRRLAYALKALALFSYLRTAKLLLIRLTIWSTYLLLIRPIQPCSLRGNESVKTSVLSIRPARFSLAVAAWPCQLKVRLFVAFLVPWPLRLTLPSVPVLSNPAGRADTQLLAANWLHWSKTCNGPVSRRKMNNRPEKERCASRIQSNMVRQGSPIAIAWAGPLCLGSMIGSRNSCSTQGPQAYPWECTQMRPQPSVTYNRLPTSSWPPSQNQTVQSPTIPRSRQLSPRSHTHLWLASLTGRWEGVSTSG